MSALFSFYTPEPSPTYRIAMVGDIMMGGTIQGGKSAQNSISWERIPKNDGEELFAETGAILRAATLALGNYEGVLADKGQSTKKHSGISFAFRTPSRLGERLKEAGFDFLSLANNHSFDYGIEGLHSTQQTLSTLGITFAGTIPSSRSTKKFVILERQGIRFGICAFGHNTITLRHTEEAIVEQVLKDARQACDILIVTFHGGAEGTQASHLPKGKEFFLGENRGNLRLFARKAILLGADLVFGHGPHVPRAIELYKGRLIAYSLGNFCTPFGINLTGILGLAPLLTVELNNKGEFVRGEIHSFRQRIGTGPIKDTTHTVAQEIRRLSLQDIPSSELCIEPNGTLKLWHSYGARVLSAGNPAVSLRRR